MGLENHQRDSMAGMHRKGREVGDNVREVIGARLRRVFIGHEKDFGLYSELSEGLSRKVNPL